MSEPHGNDSKHAHASPAEEEDPVRTPMWLPLLGIGLLLGGALASYLWIYPGTLNPTTVSDDGGTGDAAANAEGGAAPAPSAVPAAPTAPAAAPGIRPQFGVQPQLPRPAANVPQPPLGRAAQ